MLRKLILAWAVLAMGSALSYAGPIRPLLTKENKMPELRHGEVGFRFNYIELDDDRPSVTRANTNRLEYIARARYRPVEPLTVYGEVPYVRTEPDQGDGDSGLGDIVLGAELMVYQDIFDYPWVMPHAEVRLDTASDSLGAEDTGALFGLAVGSRAWEDYNGWLGVQFIGDLQYEIFSDRENVASISGAVIFDITERFSFWGEARATNEEVGVDKKSPALFLGGLSYKLTDRMYLIARGGAGQNAREDVVASFELTYDI